MSSRGLVSTCHCPQFQRFQLTLTRIQTPHRLFCGFGAHKTFTPHWSDGRVWVHVQAPAALLVIWQLLQRAIPDSRRYSRQSKVLAAKSITKPMGQRSCTAWAGQTPTDEQAQTQGISKTSAVAAASDWLAWGKHATTLPILTPRVKKVFMLYKYRPGLLLFICFHVKWNFLFNWQEVVANQSSAHWFAHFFDQPLVSEWKYDTGIKQHVPNWILCSVQSSRSKSTTCLRKGFLLRIWSKQHTEHSNFRWLCVCVHKSLETMSGMILNQPQPKFAAKSVANEMQCLKAMYCGDQCSGWQD